MTDLLESINTVKANSAAGPDEFPAILLKKCAGELCEVLARLWKQSMLNITIPSCLKQALITPIYRGGVVDK